MDVVCFLIALCIAWIPSYTLFFICVSAGYRGKSLSADYHSAFCKDFVYVQGSTNVLVGKLQKPSSSDCQWSVFSWFISSRLSVNLLIFKIVTVFSCSNELCPPSSGLCNFYMIKLDLMRHVLKFEGTWIYFWVKIIECC